MRQLPLSNDQPDQTHEQAKLKQQSAALEFIINELADAILIYDRDGEPVRVSEKVITAYGFDPTDSTRREAIERLNIRTRDGKPIAFEDLPTSRALRGECVEDDVFLLKT